MEFADEWKGRSLISKQTRCGSMALMICLLRNVVGLFAAVLIFSGCATFRSNSKPSSAPDRPDQKISISVQSEGYALLYDLVSKEKNVSKLLIIKRDSPPLKAVIQKVARDSKELARELERLAKQNPQLNLKVTHLPSLEQKTRDLIEKESGKGLLRVEGVEFEFKLLESQLEGMNYGAHLAEALVKTEADSKRRDFLQRAQRTLAGLRDEIYHMLLVRYIR